MQLNLSGPINTLSYGYVTTNILHELHNQGHEVCLFPIVVHEVDSPEVHQIVNTSIENARNKFSRNNPSLRIWHQHGMAEHVGSPIVGWPIFELDDFNQLERHHLSSLDKIVVCSQWAKGVVESTIPNKPIAVVPLGVNRNVFKEQPKQHDTFRILITGKAEYRKGHDVVPEILDVFEPTDNVEVFVSIHNPFLDNNEMNEWFQQFVSTKIGHKVKIFPRFSTCLEVASLYNSVDCGIFLSRAEGWNLPALEMLSCGKQIIITNYSAHTEFCNEANSLLVDIDSYESAYDGRFFNGDIGRWAEIGDKQKNKAREYLRGLYKAHQNGDNLTNHLGIAISKQFSWQNSVKTLTNFLGA